MKKYLLMFSVMAPMLFGCQYIEKTNQLSDENKKLINEAHMKDSAISAFTQSFDQIEGNIAEIKEKESLISVDMRQDRAELKANTKDRIIDDLKYIEGLMASNHSIINSLRTKLNKSNNKLQEFSKLLKVLNAKIEEKDKEYALLKSDLEKSSLAIQDLTNKNGDLQRISDTRAAVINEQYKTLNTAYYTTGTYKELKNRKVVVKEGSIVGIGGVKKLKNDFDKEAFKQIDIDKTQVIPIKASSKVEIVTNHNPNSYKLESENGKVERLVITDPQNFWKTSKYLVVIVNSKEHRDPFDNRIGQE